MYLIIFRSFFLLLLIEKCKGRPNFIFIIVDDLRPALGCYGDVNSWSPNIDNLARNGFLFTQAYAQQSLCAPSRNSLLTSRRPDTLKLYDFYNYWRNTVGNFTTLPQHLKDNGYITKSIGKIFHPDYHPIEKFKLHNYYWPKNVSSVAYNPWTDIRERQDVEGLNLKFPWQKIPHYFGKKIVQSYYAALSYIDDLVGQLLKKIYTLNLENNTIIVLTSDHGWSLGQHSQWGKYSNFDVALKVPLIISLPNHRNNFDKNINSIVELVDIFPTIAELAGCPIKSCTNSKDNLCSEGISFVPLINANIKNQTIKWKQAAFSQYPRPGIEPTWHPNSDKPRLDEIKIMGYTLRTKHYRYTAWIKFKNKKAYWNKILAEELYDHRHDPNEMSNYSNDPMYKKLKTKLNTYLKNRWYNF
ncbi:hypothetical protein HCN44_009257 [Aphidius gifuensis]|uniref:Sulfatase N-terminal domain-containing protein n=1 Tax=Aphidius gifuensis TaxID=684658 RepID=A0A835CV98_APHGI|nr:hypothetical protein HCN44_009257 [Aphidius gifuensis]